MSTKRPGGYTGPYTQPSTAGAPGSYVSPTEASALILQGNWPIAFVPNQTPPVEIGEIVTVLASGVVDEVNASSPGAFSIASGAVLDRTTFSDLFEVYNTTFGSGDGTSTFGTIDIPNTHSYLEGTTTSGITYPNQYRVDSVLPEHTHTLDVCISLTIRGLYENRDAGNTPTYTYETDVNTNASERNEARHLQLIRCVAQKNIRNQVVGSLQYILIPNAQPSGMPSYGIDTDNLLIPSGQDIDRLEYPDLFRRIGTKFGSGDGSTTFGLPNFLGLFSRGAENSDYVTTSGTDLPASGYLGDKVVSHTHTRGGVYYNTGNNGNIAGGAFIQGTSNTQSSDSNIGGAETRPKNITALYYIVAKGSL